MSVLLIKKNAIAGNASACNISLNIHRQKHIFSEKKVNGFLILLKTAFIDAVSFAMRFV